MHNPAAHRTHSLCCGGIHRESFLKYYIHQQLWKLRFVFIPTLCRNILWFIASNQSIKMNYLTMSRVTGISLYQTAENMSSE